MKFYIDFEATQPENEIIAIGAVAENGATFHTLVKPQLSSISKWVSDLTHISPEDLEKAPNIDKALIDFDLWMMSQESDIMKCRFIAYGDDSKFIKSTLPAITNDHAVTCAAILMAKIEDCSAETKRFFHGTIKLIHAFNYVQSVETEQKHNPLEDAIDWLIKDVMRAKEPETIHRDRIMKNIMKAVRTKKAYCSLKWRRVKEEEVK